MKNLQKVLNNLLPNFRFDVFVYIADVTSRKITQLCRHRQIKTHISAVEQLNSTNNALTRSNFLKITR